MENIGFDSHISDQSREPQKTVSSAMVSVFEFNDYGDYLQAYVQRAGRYSHGPYNLKNWAQRLGYRSPSSLAMVLNKQRLPTWRMVHSFCEDFKLGKNEKKYFEILVEIERKKQKGADIAPLLREAHRLSHLKEYQKVNFDQFAVISNWYCYVIKGLVSMRGFVPNVDWIFRVLRKKVSRSKISEAIENLIQVGIIARDQDGALFDTKAESRTGGQVPSAAIRNHHRGMMARAVEALEEQDVDTRIFQGLTLCFDRSKDKEQAFEDIRNFVEEFGRKYGRDQVGESIYQLNVQFFEHTTDAEASPQE